MMALDGAGGSMCEARFALRPRTAWGDLTNASVPAGTCFLLIGGISLPFMQPAEEPPVMIGGSPCHPSTSGALGQPETPGLQRRPLGHPGRAARWRPRSRVAFGGVSALYRALHAGISGHQQNPMLYVCEHLGILTRCWRNSSICMASRSARSCFCANGASPGQVRCHARQRTTSAN